MFHTLKLSFQQVKCRLEGCFATSAVNSTFSLQGRTALVTGSSSGIGFACAVALQAAGARVTFHGKDPRPSLVPTEAAYFEIDLATPNGAEDLASLAFRNQDEFDLLVLCAGGFFDRPFLEITPDIWEKTFALNVRSTYFLSQAFAKSRGQKGASVVIISSVNGFEPEPDSTVYDISKGALVMMTRTLAMAMAPLNIRVNGLAPGLIRTPLTSNLIDNNPVLRAHYESKILLGRIGQPQDCAAACVFLCSEGAAYITGQTLIVDGGLTCGQIGRLPFAT